MARTSAAKKAKPPEAEPGNAPAARSKRKRKRKSNAASAATPDSKAGAKPKAHRPAAAPEHKTEPSKPKVCVT